jgi:hypothetical protein
MLNARSRKDLLLSCRAQVSMIAHAQCALQKRKENLDERGRSSGGLQGGVGVGEGVMGVGVDVYYFPRVSREVLHLCACSRSIMKNSIGISIIGVRGGIRRYLCQSVTCLFCLFFFLLIAPIF